MEWLTVSKAFNNSIKTGKAYRLFSKDSRVWFANCRLACSIEWSD